MMAKSTQAEAAVTRQKIIDAAYHITIDKGFEHVTLGVLAKAVGITRSGINCHFKKKEDLVNVLEPIFSKMLTAPLDFSSTDAFYDSWKTALRCDHEFKAAVKACGPIIPPRKGIDGLINKLHGPRQEVEDSVLKCIGYATYTLS
ncbi:TetR family transcriptional regulator [Agarivorans sp. DSG3-1]|uniref:TetR family transcriptional regulator n=1 Tax=Agarivorans sp. DSG3-1 TaxID=3342249 RepID=UPI00398EF2AA